MPRVLVVDNDPILAHALEEFLVREGHDVQACADGAEALLALEAGGRAGTPVAVMLADLSMPGMDGLALLQEVARRHPGVSTIMLTGFGTVETAVRALRLGAVDYLTKPVVDEELRLSISRALRQHALASENITLRRRLETRDGLDGIIGLDPRMQRVYQLVEAVAPSRTTVLMRGESGTGKSLIARAIHQRSPRRDRPFVELACGSIPETLLESELFGHVKGAFTGAHADKPGKFLLADSGTIFLDEINSASPAMQLKLLRVLQERRFEAVGGTETREVDVRVILATNQPLEALVASGAFRQDLYYRLNVVSIDLPPLRERPGDIPALAEFFLVRYAAELGRQIVGFEASAMDALVSYAFPGNVRELQNLIERAAVLSTRPTITLNDLPLAVVSGERGCSEAQRSGGGATGTGEGRGADGAIGPILPLDEALREPERRIILDALRANHYNRQRTADALRINRTTLYKKMKSLGIDDADERLAG